MNVVKILPVLLILLLMAGMGCSNNDMIPTSPENDVSSRQMNIDDTVTQLWGYHNVSIDPDTWEVTAIPARNAMFTANVVSMLNGNPSALKFQINSMKSDSSGIEVDLNISITHPLPNMPKYNGYDVRGVFMGNGSETLSYNPDWKGAVKGTDQFMTDNPSTGFGGPDGYTRWFNLTEFSMGQNPMVEYTPGIYASGGFAGTATINPYKYFADGLGPTDDAFDWLSTHTSTNGVFSSGSTNKRNYFLHFPPGMGVKFGYAIIADWKGTAPGMHPANTREAVAMDVTVTDEIWYANDADKGGNLILDINIFDWFSETTGGVMEDYRIFIMSTVMSSFKKFTDPVPTGSGDHFYTYHIEIPADNITGTEGNEFWVVVDYSGHNYKNPYGIFNQAGNDLLAGVFRYDLFVSDATYQTDPICELDTDPSTPPNINRWETEGPYDVIFDATGCYDPDGTDLTYLWDFDGDLIFGENPDDSYLGQPNNPTHTYDSSFSGDVTLRIEDENEGNAECYVPVNIGIHPAKNIPLRSGVGATDIGVNPSNGDLYILYTDKKVFKHTQANYYDPYFASEHFTTDGSHPTFKWLDVSDKGYFVLGMTGRVGNYDPSGNLLGVDYPPESGSVRDVWTQPDDGDLYANDHLSLFGGIDGPYHITYFGRTRYPDHDQYFSFHNITQQPKTGYDQVYEAYVRGCEAMDGGNVWVLEGSPDYYCARWDLPSILYDDVYFGTGGATDDDTGFRDPKDLTHSMSDIIIVLDRLASGQARIKAWQVVGDVATSLGGAGDSVSIDSTPLRIDGSDYVNVDGDNYLFVLHGSGTNTKLSIMFPEDLPWG